MCFIQNFESWKKNWSEWLHMLPAWSWVGLDEVMKKAKAGKAVYRTLPASACCANSSWLNARPGSSSDFSSSLLFRQAALGLRFLSGKAIIWWNDTKALEYTEERRGNRNLRKCYICFLFWESGKKKSESNWNKIWN